MLKLFSVKVGNIYSKELQDVVFQSVMSVTKISRAVDGIEMCAASFLCIHMVACCHSVFLRHIIATPHCKLMQHHNETEWPIQNFADCSEVTKRDIN
jgi:hypothetical protein